MRPITYITGDATLPANYPREQVKIIAHVVNNVGAWGAGFVMALSARDPRPEIAYRLWSKGKMCSSLFQLGEVQFTHYTAVRYTMVANMCAQRGVRRCEENDGRPLSYLALAECLAKVGDKAAALSASVHLPRIGCGLAGGKWEAVEPLIEDALCSIDVPVTVYDFAQLDDGPRRSS